MAFCHQLGWRFATGPSRILPRVGWVLHGGKLGWVFRFCRGTFQDLGSFCYPLVCNFAICQSLPFGQQALGFQTLQNADGGSSVNAKPFA